MLDTNFPKLNFDKNSPDQFPDVQTQKLARSLADTLPDLLVEARNIASTVTFGWHGRRRVGLGETFWQFRQFNQGESVNRIDWRRSARDDHIYVRESEWEAAHTVWLWSDLSTSMNFGSKLSTTTKRSRAVTLMLGLGELLARGGERIGIPGLMRPVASRHSVEKLAETLSISEQQVSFPDAQPIKRFSDVVLFGDFLDPIEEIRAWLGQVTNTGANGHLVQILDPIEETFPFGGRTEFEEPESGIKLVTGRAQDWKELYQQKMSQRQLELRAITQKAGWSHIIHHTDRPASEPLLALHMRLSSGELIQNKQTGDWQ